MYTVYTYVLLVAFGVRMPNGIPLAFNEFEEVRYNTKTTRRSEDPREDLVRPYWRRRKIKKAKLEDNGR